MKIKNVNILVFGCQQIAINIIKYIRECEVIGVDKDGYVVCPKLIGVVEHDMERDRIFGRLVKEYCLENEIPVFRFDDQLDANMVKSFNADLILSVYYRKIFPPSILEVTMGVINIHPSRLPKDRGPNPTYWAVKRGARSATSSIHYVDEGMDTGDIIAQKSASIADKTGFEANKIMMDVGFAMFKENFADIICGRNKRKRQNNSIATCNSPFRNNMRYVNWNESSGLVLAHIRAHAKPYAGSIAVTSGGKELIIHNAILLDAERSSNGPGCYEVNPSGILVQTLDRPILVTEWEGEQLYKGRFIIGVP